MMKLPPFSSVIDMSSLEKKYAQEPLSEIKKAALSKLFRISRFQMPLPIFNSGTLHAEVLRDRVGVTCFTDNPLAEGEHYRVLIVVSGFRGSYIPGKLSEVALWLRAFRCDRDSRLLSAA